MKDKTPILTKLEKKLFWKVLNGLENFFQKFSKTIPTKKSMFSWFATTSLFVWM